MKAEKSGDYISYSIGSGKVPVTVPAFNSISESITANFDTSNLSVLLINRVSRQSGALRHNDQKELILMSELDSCIAENVNQNKLMERLGGNKKLRAFRDEFAGVSDSERNKRKNSFIDEISRYYGSPPKNLIDYKIEDFGLLNYLIPFKYKTTFSMENVVKKAGSDYIFEIGKLQGDFSRIEEDKRLRATDVYQPCARVYNWDIVINAPAGYSIKGAEELNKTVGNETGSFTCTSANNAGSVKIKMVIEYAHNFEKAEKWPKILELTDAFYNSSVKKLLLEKN